MKTKHNKKRNTAFLYEALVRELTKSIVGHNKQKTQQIKDIFKEHFSTESELLKELNCYRALSETDRSEPLDHYTAEKMIFSAKKEHENLNLKTIFKEQSQVIKKINTQLSTEVFKTFVPNYRAYATISQIFNSTTPVKTRVLLEKQILESLTQQEESTDELSPVDTLVVNFFSQRFNSEYSDLLPEQRNLLSKYILSFGDNEVDFRICVTNELKRIHNEVKQSLTLEEVKSDVDMIANTKRVLAEIRKFNVSNISHTDLLRILKLQNLTHEYHSDAHNL